MHIVVKAVSTTLLAYVLIYAFQLLQKRSKQRGRLPPGPPGLPVLGNLLQLPQEQEWVTYREWAKKYGDMVTVKVPGSTIIIINKRKIMTDLLDSRSAIYSDRPHLVMADDIVGWGGSVVMAHYGEGFRTNRRHLKKALGPGAVQGYIPMLEKECVHFLERLERSPEDFTILIRNTAGSIGLKIAYGEDMSNYEQLLSLTEEVMEVFSTVARPGKWLVDSFPVLQHLPSWFPMAEFKKYGEYGKRVTQELLTKPYYDVKERMISGSAGLSFISTILRDTEDVTSQEESYIQWAGTSILAGNSDTTTSLLSFFLLAMVLNPEVQKKAQAELDAVIGPDRLPLVSDRDNLSYVDGVFKEALRWHPVVPLMTRSSIQDDEYNGYTIPAGSMILSNIWSACHDEEEYKDPNAFKPERYLPPYSEPDSSTLAFGFGRRVCPGIHIAQAHVFVTIASILATFDITKAMDKEGNVIEPVEFAMSGVVSHPQDFKCTIKPRSEAARKLLQRSLLQLDA